MRRQVMGLAFLFAAGALVPLAAHGQQTPPGQPKATGQGAPTATGQGAPTATGQGAPTATGQAAPAATGQGAPAQPGQAGASAGGATPQATGTAAGGTTPAPTVAVPIPEKPAMDGATYAVRLRDLEARVDELKDQIRRSHTRLALLSDTILSGGAAGSRAEIIFRNEMSSAFLLTRALFIVDGAVQYNRSDDTGALAEQKEIPIFNGSIPPGDHTVAVKLSFRGNGFGVFTYLRGYNFEVNSAHSFTAVEGKTLQLTATALEKGGVTTPLQDRPAVNWNEKMNTLGGGGGAPAAPAPGVQTQGQAGGGAASGSISIGGGK